MSGTEPGSRPILRCRGVRPPQRSPHGASGIAFLPLATWRVVLPPSPRPFSRTWRRQLSPAPEFPEPGVGSSHLRPSSQNLASAALTCARVPKRWRFPAVLAPTTRNSIQKMRGKRPLLRTRGPDASATRLFPSTSTFPPAMRGRPSTAQRADIPAIRQQPPSSRHGSSTQAAAASDLQPIFLHG